MSITHSYKRAALVVAHPGHELKVHGWVEATRPRVFVLTDGSGRSSQSRLDSTTRILERAGAQRGSIYGNLTDSAAYAALLNREFDRFILFAEELSEKFVCEQIDLVAGDAMEGYNPMHDVCRLVINTAVMVAQHVHDHAVANFAFSLMSQPDLYREPKHDDIWLQLNEETLERKLSAARAYTELAGEVHDALGRSPVLAFGIEHLRRVDSKAGDCSSVRPFYESYGEKQVAEGHYAQVLRYQEHIMPLAEALNSYAGRPLQLT